MRNNFNSAPLAEITKPIRCKTLVLKSNIYDVCHVSWKVFGLSVRFEKVERDLGRRYYNELS